MSQTREHLFRHCSRWNDQQNTLWKTVGQATGWNAGRCQHMQISELFTIEECDPAVTDILVACEVRMILLTPRSGMNRAHCLGLWGGTGGNGVTLFLLSFPFCLSLIFHLSFVSGDDK